MLIYGTNFEASGCGRTGMKTIGNYTGSLERSSQNEGKQPKPSNVDVVINLIFSFIQDFFHSLVMYYFVEFPLSCYLH